MAESIDTLIEPRWVVPVEPAGAVLEDSAVAVHRGRIVAVLPRDQAATRYRAAERVTLAEHALLPGLVNAHTHAAMSLFRGMADDLTLHDWLHHHIWPAEAKWVSPEFVRDGSLLAVAEMIKCGTTCFNDMYFFPEETARVCAEAHMRAVLGLILIDFPSSYAQTADEYLNKGTRLHDELRGSALLSTAFAPHAPYSVSDDPLKKLLTMNGELGLPVHIHVHETAHEVEDAVAKGGRRPLARLGEHALLDPKLVAVHMTQLTDAEIAQLAETGANVVHCPQSNMKLASGFCPVERLRQAGVNVALGTDGAASNNDLDMIEEMRTAALLAKGVAASATALPAAAALRMATLNGAKALGLDDRIGSLATGKYADMVAMNLDGLASQPIYDPISQIVYAAGREQVTDVWIGGERVLQNRALTRIDEEQLKRTAARWRDKIAVKSVTGHS